KNHTMAVASQPTGGRRRAVFVALGSRGDVQPLALLASALAERGSEDTKLPGDPLIQVALVAHAELETVLRADGALRGGVEFRPLPLPCFLADAAAEDGNKSAADSCAVPCVLDLGGKRREEWVAAVLMSRDADMLVGNLFAMPVVYHLAERLGVPWFCASPSLVPYSAPPGFREGFEMDFPDLYRALCRRDEGLDGESASGSGVLSWRSVEAWLWPIFTENHALLREELLGLPPVPGYDEADQLDLASLRPGHFLLGLHRPLLDDKSLSALPPESEVCGAWLPPDDPAAALPPELESYLADCSGAPPLYVGFGSMGAAGLVPDGQGLLSTIIDAAKWMKRGAVVMAHLVEGVEGPGGGVRKAVFERLPPADGSGLWPGILLCRLNLPHSRLLPHCSSAIHHGGIGTVVACLSAGLPQLVVPLAYDQPFWGQRLQDLGVGESLALEEVSVLSLAKSLQRLLGDDRVRSAARGLGAGLRRNEEGDEEVRPAEGTAAALQLLAGAVSSAATLTRRPRPPKGWPLKPPRQVPLHKGDAAPLVWARCAGEVQYVHSEVAEKACYGDLAALRPGGLVVDAGMNLGLFSLHLAQACTAQKGEGGLLCLGFEPAAETYSLALRNLRQHGVQVVDHGNSLDGLEPGLLEADGVVVHCFQLALGAEEGEAEFCYLPHLSSNSTMARHRSEKDHLRKSGAFETRLEPFFFAEERVERVRCVRLGDVLSRLGETTSVRLLKVDVEGAEVDVLAGILTSQWPRIEGLAVEVHSSAALRTVIALLHERLPQGPHASSSGVGGGAARVLAEPQKDLPDHWMLYAGSVPRRSSTGSSAADVADERNEWAQRSMRASAE
ncbi:unnamed protein product, partial [Polarella glacialis]